MILNPPPRCPHCGRPPHEITYVRLTSERRQGTYIHAALELHVSHALTVRPGVSGITLHCITCDRAVIEAGSNGRWRGEYQIAACVLPPGWPASS